MDLDPGDLAAKEDVVLGLPMERRVESPGRDVDILRLTGHGAGESRAAVTAERAARAGFGRVTADLAFPLEEAEARGGDADVGEIGRAHV